MDITEIQLNNRTRHVRSDSFSLFHDGEYFYQLSYVKCVIRYNSRVPGAYFKGGGMYNKEIKRVSEEKIWQKLGL